MPANVEVRPVVWVLECRNKTHDGTWTPWVIRFDKYETDWAAAVRMLQDFPADEKRLLPLYGTRRGLIISEAQPKGCCATCEHWSRRRGDAIQGKT